MDQLHKPHRKSKDRKKPAPSGERNPKAFTYANAGRLNRAAARSHDIKEKRLHVPLVDLIPDEPAPRLVAIVGPPGVGKTVLLKSLIRRYAKETISDPQGPITIVTSKKQRLTFVECPNELEAMVDIAKVADVVLLMIDGNYGFEMETMEFLNVLAATGMPGNVFGILSHLDLFRKPQALKDAKRRLKRRLWAELYQGAPLFFLSGVINGRYPDREIHNLSRFLSVMKNPRPLVWRNSHPYSVIDSFRDITHPTKIEADAKCDRSIVLSGYLRGTNFAASGQRVHIPGLGDYSIANIEVLPDPCPTPAMDKAMEQATGKRGKRRLDEKDKKIHAPMSDRSGLKIEGDAIWITREKGFQFDREDEEGERGEGEELIIGLQGERKLLGKTDQGVQLFKGGDKVQQAEDDEPNDTGRKTLRRAQFAEGQGPEDFDEEDFDGSDDEDGDDNQIPPDSDAEEQEFDDSRLGAMFHKKTNDKNTHDEALAFADSDSDLGSLSGSDAEPGSFSDEDFDEDEEVAALRWKDNMASHVASLSKRPAFRPVDLARMLYNDTMQPGDVLKRWAGQSGAENEEESEEENIEDEEDGEEFFKKKQSAVDAQEEDRTIPKYNYEELAAKWGNSESIEALGQRFAAAASLGGHNSSGSGGSDNDEDPFGASDDEGDGAFEDLESGEVHGPNAGKTGAEAPESADDIEAERQRNAKRKEELKLRFEEEDREGFLNDKANARRENGATEQFGEDEWYDMQKSLLQKQLDINKDEFAQLDERQRVAVEGFRAGKYAKIVLDGVPAEFVESFNANMPIIIGGLAPTEDRFGFVQVRIKRHRWHKKILKTNDPLIFSLGWRRFQTMPVYSISDSRTRNRMLKYTPEHMHCFGTFYGPLIAPNTGFVCFNSLGKKTAGFRVAASGTVLSVDESTEIVKKLKLTGVPYKIFKNTAFIKNMFQTSLEVAKFEGAAIKTVSGIRGQIKRALSKPEGHFRATFEDKVLVSDIVFLRAWYPVKPRRFYNPVTNLIGWQAMRLTGEIRRAENIATPLPKNSQYRKITRETRHFNGLKVPRALAASLPFKSQMVATKKQKKDTYMSKRAVVLGGEEKKARALVHMLSTINKDKEAKRRAKKEEKRAEFKKRMAGLEEKKAARERQEKKDFWQKEGKKRTMAEQSGGGGKRGRR
ncbi:Ribosome biogenesis protein bms1 [Ceratocystis platani]|uniref:Ribosome biogenesis protein bms1 n=1 Tax=Ceratocystis fimbriata f. sp. platani TaxID=88771 RepID=A0A0F8CS54_CERFI|nr:Ribosome biogenesis protein bms1 [Ceratocystis platani]